MNTPNRPALGALLIGLLALQPSAWAHAYPDKTEPPVGSELDQPPTQVKIWFSGEIDPRKSSIKVMNDSDQQVDSQNAHLDPEDKSLFIVSVPKLNPGVYKVQWRAVMSDGHTTHGDFKFTIK